MSKLDSCSLRSQSEPCLPHPRNPSVTESDPCSLAHCPGRCRVVPPKSQARRTVRLRTDLRRRDGQQTPRSEGDRGRMTAVSALRIAWVIYGSLDQVSGGYIYDRL